MSEHHQEAGLADVAVVGMAGRFPKARNVEELWANLRAGVESVTFFSDEELAASGVGPELLADPNYVKGSMFLEDFDLFDAGFFEINPREAELTDPQQRVFLETAWEALEDAGCDPDRFPGSIAVFAGSGRNQYVLNNVLPNAKVMQSMGVVAAALQNEKDFLSTRVSYKLNLRGPAVTVQTACSTSLVALHLACQGLIGGEFDLALAGGVCIAALKKEGYLYIDGGIFARDGHLRAFDARASGQVGGNGAAIVVLKRLEDALRDGDSIRAVVKGSALNNDGIQKVSFSAPGVDGQARVILEALEVAGVHPESIGYVETHGTGTQLGDPIEVAALTQAFRKRTAKKGFCPIGSLKTNIGHLDAGAGVAGIIKTSLALQHKELPPSLHYETPNPEIDFESSPFFVNAELRPWESDGPRRAGVSSFGMGGTNAHVILEEAPVAETTPPRRKHELLVLSARSEAALARAAERLADHLERHPELELADVAHTLQVGRRELPCRRALVCASREEALALLRTAPSPAARGVVSGRAPKTGRAVSFLFTGQGAQYAGMTRGLYETEPVFREAIDRSCELLRASLGRDLRELLYPVPGDEEEAGEELRQTRFTQPALFVVEHALARLLASFGVEPEGMLGHSIGEYVAACLAGVLSLEDALHLVAARGQLIGALPEGGAMLAVQLTEEELRPLLGSELSIAAVNAPGLCVASGPEAALAALEAELERRGAGTRRLHTSHAFHSGLMDPVLEDFERAVRGTTLSAPTRPFVSCTTGLPITEAEARDPGYWVRHLREAVRFSDGVRALLERPRVLLEVGPGETLASLARLTATGKDAPPVVATTRHPKDERHDEAVCLLALGQLWCHGVALDWEAFRAGERRRRVPLPTYPFERQRYFLEASPKAPSAGAGGSSAAARDVQVKDPDVGRWFHVPSWRRAGPPRPAALDADAPPDRWLLFADESGWADELARRAAAEGVDCVRVSVGSGGFQVRGRDAYEIDPRNPADYADLFEELRERGRTPTRIVHLWGVDVTPRGSLEVLDAAQEKGFYSLLFLAQALGGRTKGSLRIDVVTTGMQEVLGGELTCPEKATVLGPCKAITCELSGLRCRSVDFASTTEAEAHERLWSEVRSESDELVVAWRGGHRWVPDVERLAPVAADPGSGPRLREGGTYLVTGGLGGIGLALAEDLARGAKANLILLGRTAMPDPDGYDAWIGEHGPDDATSRRIGAVRRLEALGGRVLALAADVSDPDSMALAVRRGRDRFGRIHGVIHSAGVPGAGLIELKSRGAARKVLAPKVRGTQVLEALFRDEELDFLALCSSLATSIVGVGQVDYFAANAYLDAFAWFHAGRGGLPVVAIDWDAWSEVGMAVDTDVPAALRAEREANLRLGIASAEGAEAFRRLLGLGLPQVLVSTRSLAPRIAAIEEDVLGPREAPVAAAPGEPPASGGGEPAPVESGGHARPALSTEYVAPRDSTETEIAAIQADLLGIDKVGVEDDFFELGGNSLLLMQLSARLRTTFEVSLSIRELFETPSVAALAERVESLRMAGSAARATAAGGAGDDDTEELEL